MKKFFILACICVTWLFAFSFAQKYENNVCLFENFDLVNDAIDGIRKTLDEQKNPYFVRRIYEISKNKVCVTTKSHYSEYRKKPTYKKQVLKTDTINPYEIDFKVEFIYKSSDKNHLTQINEKTKRSEPKSKKIAFQANDHERPDSIFKA